MDWEVCGFGGASGDALYLGNDVIMELAGAGFICGPANNLLADARIVGPEQDIVFGNW